MSFLCALEGKILASSLPPGKVGRGKGGPEWAVLVQCTVPTLKAPKSLLHPAWKGPTECTIITPPSSPPPCQGRTGLAVSPVEASRQSGAQVRGV